MFIQSASGVPYRALFDHNVMPLQSKYMCTYMCVNKYV